MEAPEEPSTGEPAGSAAQGTARPVIAPESLSSPDAVALIAALDADLTLRYPDPEDNHFTLTEAQVSPDVGAFLVARSGGAAVGCGAVRRLDGTTGEIKRMYVAPAARGAGIGGRILTALEWEAGRRGFGRLVLETGERQLEALRVYERAGFTRIPCFGEYAGSPVSVCMGKDLDERTSRQHRIATTPRGARLD